MKGTKATIERGGRMSAEERRDEVLNVAIVEFATYGLHGASTEAIADKAGISQPYIFRLFGTKKELFIACVGRVCGRIESTFRQAAASNPGDPLKAMSLSYHGLLTQRYELLMLLQAFAASENREVQSAVRERYAALIHFVKQASGATDEQVSLFFSKGMGITVACVLDLEHLMKFEME